MGAPTPRPTGRRSGPPAGLRILMVAPELPFPPFGGAPMRNYQFLRQLSQRHTVSLIAYGGPDAEEKRTALARVCEAVYPVPPARGKGLGKRSAQLGSMLARSSYQRRAFSSRQMQNTIDRVLATTDFDLIQVEASALCNLSFGSDATLVLDEHDITFELLHRIHMMERSPIRKLYSLVEYAKVRREESGAWYRFDGCVLTSEREQGILHRHVPGKPTVVIGNGVDLEYFYPDSGAPDPNSIVYTGRLDSRPNTDAVVYFVREILPRILRMHPEVVFTAVGTGPPEEVRRLAGPHVVVTGSVPDVRPYLRRAAVVVVPLRMGSGTRFKVPEALAMGKGVVSTTLGCEGLAVQDGIDILVADGAEAFAQQVRRLLDDPSLAGALGSSGRTMVESKYGWPSLVHRLEGFHAALVDGAAPRNVRIPPAVSGQARLSLR